MYGIQINSYHHGVTALTARQMYRSSCAVACDVHDFTEDASAVNSDEIFSCVRCIDKLSARYSYSLLAPSGTLQA